MYELLTGLCWIGATIGLIGSIIWVASVDNKKNVSASLLIPILSIIGIYYSWQIEEQHYLKYGNPYIVYGQVKAYSDNRITIYNGKSSQNTNSSQTFLRSQSSFKGLNSEDIVRVTYLDGFYHNFTIKIDRLIPEK